MKALVTYYSQTGNTEKLARAIYDAIHFEKELIPVKEVKDSKGYDIIFVGFPVQAHSVPAAVHPFFKSLPDKQPIAFFCTHGSVRGGHLPKQAIEHRTRPGPGLAGPRAGHLRRPGKGQSAGHRRADQIPGAPGLGRRGAGGPRPPHRGRPGHGKTFAKGVLAKLGH